VSDENATIHLMSDDESAEANENATTLPSTNGKGNSKAHDLIMKGHIALVSFDVETGGEECGVCQISAVAFDLQGNSLCGDFDFYVKPPRSAKWDKHAVAVHLLDANHESIKSADPIETVWPMFVDWCEALTSDGQTKVVLVAWNGTTCDIKWIHRLTSPSGEWKLKMPDGCDFFCDPYKAIKHYKTCELNPQTTGENLVLGTVYRIVTGGDLDNAHNSLVDALAQKTVMLDRRYLKIKQWNELTRPVPNGWLEEKAGGETEYGPTKAARDAAMAPGAKIMDFFLFLFPLELLKTVVEHTNNYAKQCDFDGPVGWATDQNGKVREKKHLMSCNINGKGARHRPTAADYTLRINDGWVSACMDWNTDCDWSVRAPRGSPALEGGPLRC
jgi:hypothetical protein